MFLCNAQTTLCVSVVLNASIWMSLQVIRVSMCPLCNVIPKSVLK